MQLPRKRRVAKSIDISQSKEPHDKMSDWDCSSLLGYGNNLCYFNLLQYRSEIQKMKYLHSDIASSTPDESRSSADDLKKQIFASKYIHPSKAGRK